MTRRTWARLASVVLLATVIVQTVSGCHEPAPAPRPAELVAPPSPVGAQPPRPPTPAPHGYFNGWASIGGEQYLTEALLTVDGAMRVLAHGPYVRDGIGLRPSESAAAVQFVGAVSVSGEIASGSGTVVGHPCASPGAHEFCGFLASAQVEITTRTRESFDGALAVVRAGQTETWQFELSWADNLYLERATTASIEGARPEQFAEWAKEGEVVTTIGDDGALFFQSASTACVGNGWLTPHGDGEFNVYDASLTVEACAAEYAHLTGVFEGLATKTTSHSGWYCGFYGDDCSGLTIWLSTPAGAARPRAVAMWIAALY